MIKFKAIAIAAALTLGIATTSSPAAAGEPSCIGDTPQTVIARSERDASIYRLYCAFFLRQPDYAGWEYWTGRSDGLGHTATQFADSEEFQLTYGSLSDTDFVYRTYMNVMGREPDRAGYGYWLQELTRISRGDMFIYFSESAEFKALTGVRIDPGVPAAPTTGTVTFGTHTLGIAKERCSLYDRDSFNYSGTSFRNSKQLSNGGWFSPWDGKVVFDAHVDHVVAIHEAWCSGARDWSLERRTEFGNDPYNFVMSSATTNIDKSNLDVAEWTAPVNNCVFVVISVQVKDKYDLTIDRAEADALGRLWPECSWAENAGDLRG